MAFIHKPISISGMNSAYNFNDYLCSSSPPAFALTSLLSTFDTPFIKVPSLTDASSDQHKEPFKSDKEVEEVAEKASKDEPYTIFTGALFNSSATFDLPTNQNTSNATNHLKDHFFYPSNTKLTRNHSCPHPSLLKKNKMRKHPSKRVWFADDKGRQLVHVKVIPEVKVGKSNSLPNAEWRECLSEQLKEATERLGLMCTEASHILATDDVLKLRVPTYAYYAQFSQPISYGHVLERKLKEDEISLESAFLTCVEAAATDNEEKDGDGDDNFDKNLRFTARIAVSNESSKDGRVFIRVSCDDWNTFRDIEALYQPNKNYLACNYSTYVASTSLKELRGGDKDGDADGGGNDGDFENDSGGEESRQIEDYFPMGVEFAVCCRGCNGERWDNNNTHNYRLCRFYK